MGTRPRQAGAQRILVWLGGLGRVEHSRLDVIRIAASNPRHHHQQDADADVFGDLREVHLIGQADKPDGDGAENDRVFCNWVFV